MQAITLNDDDAVEQLFMAVGALLAVAHHCLTTRLYEKFSTSCVCCHCVALHDQCGGGRVVNSFLSSRYLIGGFQLI